MEQPAHTVRLPRGHEISDARARLPMAFVLDSLTGVYWGADRAPGVVERSWAHCMPVGVYRPDGTPAGFGRVLTDYASRAHLGDVFIHPDARGLGLGKALVAFVLDHPALADVRHWTLTTRDAHSLYTRHGFRLGEADGRWMTLDRGPTLAPASATDQAP